MAVYFISDLHLDPAQPARITLAVNFLHTHASSMTALYLLGDIFNLWLGDDLIPDAFQPLITQFRQMHEQGIALFFMVGNRDFLLGQRFAALTGCQPLADPHILDLYGNRTLLMHGDTLCTDDVSYQRYRRWTRHPVLQKTFLHLPATLRQRIADRIKQRSQQAKKAKAAPIMDVNPEHVSHVMHHYRVTLLIHGHTHRPAIHRLNETAGYRVVLGDWQDTPSYVRCNAQGLQLFDSRLASTPLTLTF